MRRYLVALVVLVQLAVMALPVRAEAPQTAVGSLDKAVQKCVTNGWAMLFCGIGINLISSCIWSPDECANRFRTFKCNYEYMGYLQERSAWYAQGNQEPYPPFRCSLDR